MVIIIIIISSRVVVVESSFYLFVCLFVCLYVSLFLCFTPVDILNLIFRFDKVCSIWPKGCCIVVIWKDDLWSSWSYFLRKMSHHHPIVAPVWDAWPSAKSNHSKSKLIHGCIEQRCHINKIPKRLDQSFGYMLKPLAPFICFGCYI